MAIEELTVLPTHKKGEDGYYYDEKYVGNLYSHKDKLILFTEKSYMEYPKQLLTELQNIIDTNNSEISVKLKELDFSNEIKSIKTELSAIEGHLKQLVSDRANDKDENESKIDTLFKSINNVNNLVEKINTEASVKFKYFADNIEQLDKKISEINTLDVDEIESVIDKKLSDVYDNFKSVSEQLTKSAVQEALKDTKRDQVGKLKMSSLAMLKELDYKPEDIKILSEAGLI